MTILIAIFLGILQGLTEFLPVSSSGHLLLFEHIFSLEGSNIFFNVLLHFATLLAVVIVFFKDVMYLIRHPLSHETRMIALTTLPTIVIALLFKFFVDEYKIVAFLGFGFLISATLILLTCILRKKEKSGGEVINAKRALLIGSVQGLAVLPGISRSASTICTGLLSGVDRETSAKFSFLVSLPVIFGGMVFEIFDGVKNGFGNVNAIACILGFLAAFLVALFTIKFMMKIVKGGKWLPFAIYLFLLSIFVILNQFWLHII